MPTCTPSSAPAVTTARASAALLSSASALCILAGLVRPTGLVLAIVVCAAAVRRIVTGGGGARVWIALVSAPLGIVGFLSYAPAVGTAGYTSNTDSGAILTYSHDAMLVITVAVVLGYLALGLLAIRDKLSWPVVAYGIGATLMAVQSSVIMNPKARLLLVAFPLLIPLAVRIARRDTRTLVITAAVYTLAGGWFSAYSLFVWKYAI